MSGPVVSPVDRSAAREGRPSPLPPPPLADEFAKRALDLALGLPATLALLPFGAVIAVAIKVDSRGPVFFRQQRRGRGYRPFRVYKFRTLRHAAADPYDGYEMQGDDTRITRVGRLLRRFSLDELPQVLNVLAGSMSLVGARPLDDWESARCLPDYEARFDLRPGLTGLTQIMGRNRLRFAERGELDVQYVRNWSLREDLRILLKTPWVVASGEGLYPTQAATEDSTRWGAR